jgi:hypothetical protein
MAIRVDFCEPAAKSAVFHAQPRKSTANSIDRVHRNRRPQSLPHLARYRCRSGNADPRTADWRIKRCGERGRPGEAMSEVSPIGTQEGQVQKNSRRDPIKDHGGC